MYVCFLDLSVNNRLKCSLNLTVLFLSLGEYKRPKNNVRKLSRLFLDLFVNIFPSPAAAKIPLRLMTKDCDLSAPCSELWFWPS